MVSGAGERNPTRVKVWVQGAGTQRRPDLRDRSTCKGVRTSGVSRDRPTIHSQAFILSSSDAWCSSMFPKN